MEKLHVKLQSFADKGKMHKDAFLEYDSEETFAWSKNIMSPLIPIKLQVETWDSDLFWDSDKCNKWVTIHDISTMKSDHGSE